MKLKWLAIFWILLMLGGCAVPASPVLKPEDSGPTMEQTTPTEPVGVVSFLSVHSPQPGLTVLDPQLPDLLGFRVWGEDLLLFSGWEETTLTLCSGETGQILAQTTLPIFLSAEDPTVTFGADYVTYFDHTARELIFLDHNLTLAKKIHLDVVPNGGIALCEDQTKLFYCTDSAVWVVDFSSGIHRLVARLSLPDQHLVALHCADTVLQCDSGNQSLFLDAATGAVLWEASEPLTLWTWEDFYITAQMDGQYQELISGSAHFGPSVLVTGDPVVEFAPVPQQRGVVVFSYNPEATVLDFYDLETGLHPYSLTLPCLVQPAFMQSGHTAEHLWFALWNERQSVYLLYRWDLTVSATEDSGQYLQNRFSRDQPDIGGLARCTRLAWEIGEKHGVEIRIYEDAVACQPWDYRLTSEYQVPLIEAQLRQIDETLSRFPDGFWVQAAAQTGSEQIILCLVRTIVGVPGQNVLASAHGIQFWDEDANAYVAIAAGESIKSTLIHELFHIIDSRVLGVCNAYDNWEKLNPKGFSYAYDYNAEIRDIDLTSGPDPYFLDAYSMTYPKEDRARILEYAMLEGQSHRFSASHLQAKLRQLCIGIRKAFSLDTSFTYPWEQYLAEPIT